MNAQKTYRQRKRMQSRADQVIDNFIDGYNCCQSFFSTYSTLFGVNREMALKLTAGLGGGVGNSGEICGFVNAACMLLGLKHGTDAPESPAKVSPICFAFCDDFTAKCGSVLCRDLIERNIRTAEETLKAKEDGVFSKICEGCGRVAAELLEKKYGILDE